MAAGDDATRPNVLDGLRSQVGMVRGNRAVNKADRNLGATCRDLHNGVSPTKSSPALQCDWRKPYEAAVAPSPDIIVIPASKADPSSGGCPRG